MTSRERANERERERERTLNTFSIANKLIIETKLLHYLKLHQNLNIIQVSTASVQ